MHFYLIYLVVSVLLCQGASEVKVTLLDQSSYTAKVVGIDPDKDVAVLQLQMADDKIDVLRPVSVGSSGGLLVGQKVFAIGNPFGLDHTITQVRWGTAVRYTVAHDVDRWMSSSSSYHYSPRLHAFSLAWRIS